MSRPATSASVVSRPGTSAFTGPGHPVVAPPNLGTLFVMVGEGFGPEVVQGVKDAVGIGLGRIVALYYRSSTSYQIH